MRLKKILSVLFFIPLLSGCSSGTAENEGTYEKIQKNLINMQTYQCEADVKYISNKGENDYSTKQFCKITGEYRIETNLPEDVNGNIIIFDGKMIWHYNPKVESKISVNTPDKPERREILLSSFVENYVKSQNVTVETASFDEGKCTVLEAEIPGDKKYFSTEKLWVDNDSLLPVQLVVYDTDGNERIIVTYKSFEYNPKLEDSIFKLDSVGKGNS